MIKRHWRTVRYAIHTGSGRSMLYIYNVLFDYVRDVNSEEDRMKLESTHNAISARRIVRLNHLTYRMNIHKSTHTHSETNSSAFLSLFGVFFFFGCWWNDCHAHTDDSVRSPAIKTHQMSLFNCRHTLYVFQHEKDEQLKIKSDYF